MGRFKGCDEPLHTLACCGCLGWVILLKMVLFIPICFLYSCTVGIGIGLWHFVRIYPQVLWSCMIFQGTTWRIAIILCALSTIPAAIYLVGMPLAGVFIGVVLPMGMAFELTFSVRYEWYEVAEIVEPIKEITDAWLEFGDKLERAVRDWGEEPLADGDMPFDISAQQIVVGCVLAAIAAVVILPLWFVVCVVKLLPGMCMVWKGLADETEDAWGRKNAGWKCFCTPFIGLAFVLAPVGSLVYMVLCMCHGVMVVLAVPWVYYDERSVVHTLWFMPLIVREFDRRTTGVLARYFDWDELSRWSLFELCGCCNLPTKDRSLMDKVDGLVLWEEATPLHPASDGGNLCCITCVDT